MSGFCCQAGIVMGISWQENAGRRFPNLVLGARLQRARTNYSWWHSKTVFPVVGEGLLILGSERLQAFPALFRFRQLCRRSATLNTGQHSAS